MYTVHMISKNKTSLLTTTLTIVGLCLTLLVSYGATASSSKFDYPCQIPNTASFEQQSHLGQEAALRFRQPEWQTEWQLTSHPGILSFLATKPPTSNP
jgi:hypothetical protein